MNIQPWPELTEQILAHIKARVNVERDGTHLSDLLYCNHKVILRKRGESPPISDDQAILFFTGHAFQYLLCPKPEAISMMGEQVEKEFIEYFADKSPKSYEIDGILLTPDIEDYKFGNTLLPLGELKTTRANMKYFKPEENKQYLEQLMGYCLAKKLTEGALIILFLMGSYSPPFPQLGCWQCEFTQEEIDDKWKEFLWRKAIIERSFKSGEWPVEFHQAFQKECSYCEVFDLCPRGKK